MLDNTALCTARSLQNLSVVSNNHCKSVSSSDSVFNKSFNDCNSVSLISFLLLSSINIVSFVGKFLYFSTKAYTSSI